MAYMSQERKAQIAPVVKAILKKYGLKGSLSVNNHMTLVLTVTQGPIDFIGNFNEIAGELARFRDQGRVFNKAVGRVSVNPYWYHEHFSGKALNFLMEVVPALNAGNHDRSDIMSDYFDVGWYVDVNVGKWNKPYALI
jgi:hypothetical protein